MHGLRSLIPRFGAGETTSFPHEVLEMALAHAVFDTGREAAYRRGDMLEKRRQLMNAWAAYCAAPPERAGDNVQAIRRRPIS